jgi:putative SOS response-associated peptidase YedK
MAGLFDTWENPLTKEINSTFSILTCEANSFMAEIHNRKKRMPLILNANDEESWLNGENEIKDFQLKSNPDLDAHPVDSRILLGSNPNVYEAQLKFELKNLQQTMF